MGEDAIFRPKLKRLIEIVVQTLECETGFGLDIDPPGGGFTRTAPTTPRSVYERRAPRRVEKGRSATFAPTTSAEKVAHMSEGLWFD